MSFTRLIAQRLSIIAAVCLLGAACGASPNATPTPTPAPTAAAHTIIGTVLIDRNGDGVATALNEGPLAGVTIDLSGCGPAMTALSLADGRFVLSNVPNGDCVLTVTLAGWRAVSVSPGGTYPLRLHVSEAIIPPVSIFVTDALSGVTTGSGQVSGVVSIDLNGDLLASLPGEGPLAGADVWLAGCGPLQHVLSDTVGAYKFAVVPPGECLLSVSTRDGRPIVGSVPSAVYPVGLSIGPTTATSVAFWLGPVSAAVAATATPSAGTVPVASPTPNSSLSPLPTPWWWFPAPGPVVPSGAPIPPGGVIRGRIWGDRNPTENYSPPTDGPLAGATVYLIGCTPTTLSTTTDANGDFAFISVPAGICLLSVAMTGYTYKTVIPPGFAYPVRVIAAPYSQQVVELVMLRL